MRLPAYLLSSLALAALGGCARSAQSAGPATAAPAPGGAVAARTATAAAGGIRWTGSLTPTQQRSGGMGPRSQSRAFGNVTITALAGQSRSRAQVTVATSSQNVALPWAVLPGQCGTGSLPLMNVNSFPVIEVGSNGRGDLSTEIPLAMPEEGSFHVNVYWPGGQQLDEVMTCANLKRAE